MPHQHDTGRSRYWVLLPLALAVLCFIASFVLPVHIGNWVALIGAALTLMFFLQVFRGRGDQILTPFSRRR